MADPNDPPLDEIQWRSPDHAAAMQGIHSNSVLFYFAESPFFDRTSNNAVITNQAMFNPALLKNLATREAFEGELDKMSGLEFRVLHAPADMVTGTGVWTIVKQTRQKNLDRNRWETKPLAYYFVVGENIYQAPTLGDILSSKIESIAEAMRKVLPATDSVRKWTPSLGHVYTQPTQSAISKAKEAAASVTPTDATAPASKTSGSKKDATATELERLAMESFFIHSQHGADYFDENPITGRPGDFHFASTGRKDNSKIAPPPPPAPEKSKPQKPVVNTKIEDAKKDGKAEKSPKTPSMPKPKRKKSKIATPAATPAPSQ
ncbi:Mediator of RNA polymerase II transcription subunit 6 [Colletotrichum sidae]|uniref:Mediator of RNA polymerase II transcription subunit 6 n=3 Tax=Colletotrichum orbiculare species complex TaxID=2707354 RepID=A0A4R8RF27_COLTR|nr:Mediator of RNA polymerase II transcription subunit 6 [Colletotrichum spinosum]TDZ53448.1 Mediator of RNA polymerase II transcription subunit 6 [Colletotrichum trifolii]TEA21249.1 Mediator of RNA polymerase II transcription subunit 6 [Colletotrichum sidae]